MSKATFRTVSFDTANVGTLTLLLSEERSAISDLISANGSIRVARGINSARLAEYNEFVNGLFANDIAVCKAATLIFDEVAADLDLDPDTDRDAKWKKSAEREDYHTV